MSVLGEQIKELRELAGDGSVEWTCTPIRASVLREAADAIERLRDMLQVLQGVTDESRYTALFGTPEKAARTLVDNCGKMHFCDGCPADTGKHDCTYDALLEWLRGEDEVIDEPDTIRNELADGGLIADVLTPVCVDEKERRAFERGRVHERFAQQIFKEAGMRGDAE